MISKITVVGADATSATIALLLAQRDYADVVVLDEEGTARHIARDVAQASALLGHEPRVTGTSDWAEAAGSSVVVMGAGRETVAGSAGEISRRCPDAVVIVISEPVEEMCALLRDATLFTRSHVLGIVGVVQSARLRAAIAREADASVHDVTAMVVGGPGASPMPVPTHTTVGGRPVRDVLGSERLDAVAAEIGTPADVATVAAAVRVVVDAIMADTGRVLVCTALCQGEFGIDGQFANVPVRIGREGIDEIVEIPLDEGERALLAQPA